MKILHVIPSIGVADGGTSQAVLGLCRALRELGLAEAEIATTALERDDRRSGAPRSGENASAPGVPVWALPRIFSEAWKYSPALSRWLSANASRYELIHVHGVFSYATTAACRAGRRARVPVVLTPHGMLARYSRRHKILRKLLYWHLIEKRNLAAVDCLHATAPAEQRELEQLLPGRRVESIPLGLDAASWEAPACPGGFRRRYGIAAQRRLLLYLSRLHPKKGLLDCLLPALAKLPANVHLAIVGDADPTDRAYGDRVRREVDRLGLAERVTLTGSIYGPEKWAAYDDADLYVLPSIHENFGMTVIEAMARGVPCIVSPGVQSGPLVLQAGAGRVVDRSVAALTAAIGALLDAPRDQRQEMGHRGRQFVRQELAWSRTADRLSALYSDLLRAGR